MRTIERNRDVILGVKVRLSRNIAGENDLKALHLAREAADAVKLPLMAHIGDTHTPLEDLLPVLRQGDVITHCFHGREGGILDDKGRVRPEVLAAVDRGVHLDVGHGAGSFAFDVAERAIKQGLLPGTISSDLHQFNIHGPVFDLATTLSKFLHLGLTLEQVIARVTTHPAKTFGFAGGLGTLARGGRGRRRGVLAPRGGFPVRRRDGPPPDRSPEARPGGDDQVGPALRGGDDPRARVGVRERPAQERPPRR